MDRQIRNSQDVAVPFEEMRPMLLRAAYRMLGSVTDAEDIVQDAFLRWESVDRAKVDEPAAYLRTTVVRLCLDHLGSPRNRREDYVGLWLPEPVLGEPFDEVDDITLPLMLALERLSPLERAAFLLHDVFGSSFAEIAETLGRDPASCRQLASRARRHIRSERARFTASRQSGLELARAFFTASRSGDLDTLKTMLARDVTIHADGGGKVATTLVETAGIQDALRLHAALARLFARSPSRLLRFAFINGLPGFVTLEQGHVLQTTAFDISRGRIAGIYVIRNPEKLGNLARSIASDGLAIQ